MSDFSTIKGTLDAMNEVTNTLSANVDKVVTNEAAQLALIQALKDQIAQGTPITQEQLNELQASADARKATLESISSALASIASDPAAPVPEVPPVDPGVEVPPVV